MNRLEITEDGKLCVSDYKSIYKAVLQELHQGPKRILELVTSIRNKYHEFKYIKDQIIVSAIGELIKARMIVSRYQDNY